ncbi:DUF2972 domain-containing protein, partial [Campylobacter upsaliensis]|nr:DUF2972 domain-containing protein [Campylobacter upsaliensis]
MSRGLKILKEQGLKSFLKYRAKKFKNSFAANLNKHFGKFYPKLPQNYNFMLFAYGVSGHLALLNFLKFCGLNEIFAIRSGTIMSYSEIKNKLISSTGKNFLTIAFYRPTKKFKLANLFCDVPIIITLRDPISRLKTAVNHGYLSYNNFTGDIKFELNINPNEALGTVSYDTETKELAATPQISCTKKIVDELMDFKYASNLTPFLGGGGNSRQVIYIDVEDLKADKAFDTMQKLSKILHFNPPKEEDRAKFECKAWDDYRIFLPFIVFIDHKDFPQLKEKITIVVTKEQELQANLKDAKNLFLNENDLCYKHIGIGIEQKHYELIKKDEYIKERLKSYFKEFVKALDEKANFRKQHALNENDVLEYFKNNATLALKLKALLDRELTHIKQTRPDIIEKWKHYAEFEKICKEFARIEG